MMWEIVSSEILIDDSNDLWLPDNAEFQELAMQESLQDLTLERSCLALDDPLKIPHPW